MQRGQIIIRVAIPVTAKHCPFHEGSSSVNQPALGSELVTLGNDAIWGLSVNICCWKTGYSMVAMASWPWREGVRVAEPVCNLHPCHHGHFAYELIGQ